MTENRCQEKSPSISESVHEIANIISHGYGLLDAGDRAQLRRMNPKKLDAPGFFKLMGAVLAPHFSLAGEARDDFEMRWAAVVVGLAHLGPLHKHGFPLGKALVNAKFSELRFIRLLRADTRRLMDEIPMLARFLAAKNVDVDFTGAAYLLLSHRHEETRRRLAREYYEELNRKTNDQPTEN